MRLSFIFPVLLCALILTGCNSSRKTVSPAAGPVAVTVSERYDVLTGSYGGWTDVTVPLSIDIVSPKGFSISGRARMIRGKSVDISLRMLGFEVGRLYATTDSVYGMVKVGKTYMAESLAEIFPGMPFTLGNLQDMLMGRLFYMGSDSPVAGDFKKFDAESVDGGWILIPKTHPAGLEYGFNLTLDNLLRSLVIAVTQKNIVAQCDYSAAYVDSKMGPLMSDLRVKSDTPRYKIDASLSWRWNDARWNEGAVTNWSMPKGYKLVKAADLVKSIK